MNPPKNHFHGFNFHEFYYSAILHHIIYNFANFISANLKKSRKERKLLASKVSGYTVQEMSKLFKSHCNFEQSKILHSAVLSRVLYVSKIFIYHYIVHPVMFRLRNRQLQMYKTS